MANEKRLIDANDAISKLEDEIFMCKPVSKDDGYLDEYKKRVIPKLLRNVIDWLQNQPTVDAVEVVHGRWLKHHSNRYECSCCKVHFITCRAKDWNYCPNCGARMDLQ